MRDRIIRWIAMNQKRLLLAFVLIISASVTAAILISLRTAGENKAAVALYQTHGDPALLEKVVKDFPKTKAGVFAVIDLATHALDTKDFDGCIGHYQKVFDWAGKQSYFRLLSLQGMGVCTRAKGDYQAAALFFDRATGDPENLAPTDSRFETIRTFQMAKDPKVKGMYEELLQTKNLPISVRSKVEEQLKWLSAQEKS